MILLLLKLLVVVSGDGGAVRFLSGLEILFRLLLPLGELCIEALHMLLAGGHFAVELVEGFGQIPLPGLKVERCTDSFCSACSSCSSR